MIVQECFQSMVDMKKAKLGFAAYIMVFTAEV